MLAELGNVVDSLVERVPTGSVIMIRPDGHIGFRYPSSRVEALTTLDRHLSSYLYHRRSGSG
jgi:hypothetical protein